MASHRSPAEAGFSQTTPTGSDASLAGPVFDPSFIPFLPFAIEPKVYPKFAGSPGLVSAADRHSNTERKFANVGKGVGEIRNV